MPKSPISNITLSIIISTFVKMESSSEFSSAEILSKKFVINGVVDRDVDAELDPPVPVTSALIFPSSSCLFLFAGTHASFSIKTFVSRPIFLHF